MDRRIAKILSANDTGETGGHQAGILIPKEPHLLSFFPELDPKQYNPRVHLRFLDDGGTFWEFAFIYYNNALFDGTRNEYRLTRMTKYFRQAGLIAGDELILSLDGAQYLVSHHTERNLERSGSIIKLGAGWRTVPI